MHAWYIAGLWFIISVSARLLGIFSVICLAIESHVEIIDSSRPSDVIWHQRNWPSLVFVDDCTHYLSWCWILPVMDWKRKNKLLCALNFLHKYTRGCRLKYCLHFVKISVCRQPCNCERAMSKSIAPGSTFRGKAFTLLIKLRHGIHGRTSNCW